MEVLMVLFVVFGLALFIIERITKRYDIALAARLAMAAMLLFTASGHFIFTEGMSLLLPEYVLYPKGWVYLTGLLEMIAAVCLLLPRFRKITGWMLILFFILIFPANIKEGVDHIDIYKANYEGEGLRYLWYRIPMQALFITWVYRCAIKVAKPVRREQALSY